MDRELVRKRSRRDGHEMGSDGMHGIKCLDRLLNKRLHAYLCVCVCSVRMWTFRGVKGNFFL